MMKFLKRLISYVCVVCITMQGGSIASLAEDTMINPITPDNLTFRKVWNYRNFFNSKLDVDVMDFETAAGNNAQIEKQNAIDRLSVENNTDAIQADSLPIGKHIPFGAYDIEIASQELNSTVGLELYSDEENKIRLTSSWVPPEQFDTSFVLPEMWLDLNNESNLTFYHDLGQNTNEVTSKGIKLIGDTSGQGESYIRIGEAKQGGIYQSIVSGHSTVNADAVLKLRKDKDNSISLNVASDGAVRYEVVKNSVVSNTSIIAGGQYTESYSMQIEIEGSKLIFTKIVGNQVQTTQKVDISQEFDLTNPTVLDQFEAVFGLSGSDSSFVEYSAAGNLSRIDRAKDIDFSAPLNVYFDEMTGSTEADKLSVNYIDGKLRLVSPTRTTSRGASFVTLGKAAQGVAYEATILEQSLTFSHVLLRLRKDSQNVIDLRVTNSGEVRWLVTKGGSVEFTSSVLNKVDLAFPYTMSIEIQGNNLVLTRRYSDGSIQYTTSVDASSYFNFSDPSVLSQFEVTMGARAGQKGAEFVEYSSARIIHPDIYEAVSKRKIELDIYSNGAHTYELLDTLFDNQPLTLRADFAAEAIISKNVKRGWLSVWRITNGKSTLLGNNIDVKTDFSDPAVVYNYNANLFFELSPGSHAVVTDCRSYINSGAAQADPKPLHDETGAILKEGDTIWLGMTVRGYDINSSYQGVYSLDLRTGELKIVSLLLYNYKDSGRYGPFHAADIIYDTRDGKWITMPTAHNESPHSIKSGEIPVDPRTVPFQFVEVNDVQYPNQSNEEDASLIYDYEAQEWRLVMCDSISGYQLPLYRADNWDGVYTEIGRYAETSCTGIQLQKLDGKYYVFFGRGVDNCEALSYPSMDNPVVLNIESSPRANNVWPVMIPFYDETLGRERLYMLSFDRENHGGQHSYGNIYLYESLEYSGMPTKEAQLPAPEGVIENGEISTGQQLAQIRNNLSGNYILKNNIDLSDYEDWVPIGDKQNPFTGSFNGNGYAITNLSISRPNTNDVGLFGRISAEASISNLAVANATVVGNVYVGALAGYNGGIINNCRANGSVTSFSAGGILAGQNIGKIENSGTSGNVTATGGDGFGGLVGVNSQGNCILRIFVTIA